MIFTLLCICPAMCLLWESKLLGLTVDRSGLILLTLTIPSPIIFLVVYVLFKPSNQVIQPLDKNVLLYPPQTLFVGGILFSRCLSVRPSVCACVRPSVTLCFLNILKNHCWIFIKPCKHVHICKTNFLDKKVRARGQFYQSYFPL